MNFKQFLQKNKIIILLGIIILVSMFFRFYHHRDFLHFQLDQSRDSALIKDVFEKGPSELPLLGPRAGGSFLRLGPFYYYLLYLTVVITGSTDPAVFAWPDILAGILLVPFLYLLLRRILNVKWSLITTFLATTSTFLITYDRFSWNPNMMPLFTVATIYSFLRYFENKRAGNKKASLKWMAILALITGLFTQLHFVAFVALPIVLGITFLIFFLKGKFIEKSPEMQVKKFVKEIAVFLLIFVFTQTPIILNEFVSKGSNTQQLFQTVGEKQDKDTSHTTLEKLIQNLWVYPKGFWISTTGNISIDYPVWKISPARDIRCDLFCRENFSTTVLASFFWLGPILAFFWVCFKKTKEVLKSDKKSKKYLALSAKWDLLAITFIWVMIPWWAFYSLSFSLRPRFFLFSIIPFWIIIGIFLSGLARKSIGRVVAFVVVFLILASNLFQTYQRFEMLRSANVENRADYPKDLMLFQDENYPVTLQEQERVASWIREKYEFEGLEQGKDKILFWAPSFYYRPIIYLLKQEEMVGTVHYFSSGPSWSRGDYFAVTQTDNPQDFFREKTKGFFNVEETKIFGTLTVYHLSLTDQGRIKALENDRKFTVNQEFGDKEASRCDTKPKPTCRYTWGDAMKAVRK